jgi:DNA-directed RNA polymerase specialized sigma24 family protein
VNSNRAEAVVALIKPRPGAAPGGRAREKSDAETAVTELYQAHALGLTRLAHVMLGDQPGAEDVVHDAFYGLYRRWDKLADTGKAQQYLRSSVLNGCRTELRRGYRRGRPRDTPRAELRGRAEDPAGPKYRRLRH